MILDKEILTMRRLAKPVKSVNCRGHASIDLANYGAVSNFQSKLEECTRHHGSEICLGSGEVRSIDSGKGAFSFGGEMWNPWLLFVT
jgi:hypothetical protein